MLPPAVTIITDQRTPGVTLTDSFTTGQVAGTQHVVGQRGLVKPSDRFTVVLSKCGYTDLLEFVIVSRTYNILLLLL